MDAVMTKPVAHLCILFCIAGMFASCGRVDPGLKQRLDEVEAERDSLEQEIVEIKAKNKELLAKKREQISDLEKELKEAKARATAAPPPPPTRVADNNPRTTNNEVRDPDPVPPRTPPTPVREPDPKGVIFTDAGVEYFIGSDGVKRRVFRRSDNLAYVKIDGKIRLLPGVESR